MFRQFTLPLAAEDIPAGATIILDTERRELAPNALLAFRHNETGDCFIGRCGEIRERRGKEVIDYEDCEVLGRVVNWFEGAPAASQTRHWGTAAFERLASQ
jgi:hypothetical protein